MMFRTAWLILALCSPLICGASTYTVCSDCKLTSIKSAIGLAVSGDTIMVQNGLYKEYNILVEKSLVILGSDWPVIDGDMQGEIFKITADEVVLDGFRIRNVGVSFTSDFAAVRVSRAKNFVIRNLRLENLFFGIYLERAREGVVTDNEIRGDAEEEFNSGNGIQLWHCNNVLIANNHVEGVRDGIYLEFSDAITIRQNTSVNNVRYGLHFMFSNDDVYEDNVFQENGAGVAVMFSKRIKMIGNRFSNNWGPASFGLLLKEINDAEIIGNTFLSNTVGINVEGSNRIRYERNHFISNGWALKVRGACYTNTITRNNFMGNSFDLAYNSKPNDNVFSENFWSNYSGYDLNKDGVGDVPYRPVKLFSYVVNRTPETIILLRSLFMDILDFSERVSPIFTPDNLVDPHPLMKQIK